MRPNKKAPEYGAFFMLLLIKRYMLEKNIPKEHQLTFLQHGELRLACRYLSC